MFFLGDRAVGPYLVAFRYVAPHSEISLGMKHVSYVASWTETRSAPYEYPTSHQIPHITPAPFHFL